MEDKDTIEQAARAISNIAAPMIQSLDPLAEGRVISRFLAARGLLADGTDRRRIEQLTGHIRIMRDTLADALGQPRANDDSTSYYRNANLVAEDRARIEKALTLAHAMADQLVNGPEADDIRAVIAALTDTEDQQP